MWYENPLHPYTQALLSQCRLPDPYVEEKRQRIIRRAMCPAQPIRPPGMQLQHPCRALDLCHHEPDPPLVSSLRTLCGLPSRDFNRSGLAGTKTFFEKVINKEEPKWPVFPWLSKALSRLGYPSDVYICFFAGW